MKQVTVHITISKYKSSDGQLGTLTKNVSVANANSLTEIFGVANAYLLFLGPISGSYR